MGDTCPGPRGTHGDGVDGLSTSKTPYFDPSGGVKTEQSLPSPSPVYPHHYPGHYPGQYSGYPGTYSTYTYQPSYHYQEAGVNLNINLNFNIYPGPGSDQHYPHHSGGHYGHYPGKGTFHGAYLIMIRGGACSVLPLVKIVKITTNF